METIYHELLYPSPVYPGNYFDITNSQMKGSSARQLVYNSNAMINTLNVVLFFSAFLILIFLIYCLLI